MAILHKNSIQFYVNLTMRFQRSLVAMKKIFSTIMVIFVIFPILFANGKLNFLLQEEMVALPDLIMEKTYFLQDTIGTIQDTILKKMESAADQEIEQVEPDESTDVLPEIAIFPIVADIKLKKYARQLTQKIEKGFIKSEKYDVRKFKKLKSDLGDLQKNLVENCTDIGFALKICDSLGIDKMVFGNLGFSVSQSVQTDSVNSDEFEIDETFVDVEIMFVDVISGGGIDREFSGQFANKKKSILKDGFQEILEDFVLNMKKIVVFPFVADSSLEKTATKLSKKIEDNFLDMKENKAISFEDFAIQLADSELVRVQNCTSVDYAIAIGRSYDLDHIILGELLFPKLEAPLDTTSLISESEEEAKYLEAPNDYSIANRALLHSAIIPGWGELEMNHKCRAAYFLAAEIAGWSGYFLMREKGLDLEDEFKDFADTHWGYDRWKTFDVPWEIANSGSHNFEYFDTTETAETVHRDWNYYENIGKYEQYVGGWDDVNVDLPVPNSKHRGEYNDMRLESNKALKAAGGFVTMVILNHLISAVDAGWLSLKYASQEAKFSVRLDPQLTPQMNLQPKLCLEIKW